MLHRLIRFQSRFQSRGQSIVNHVIREAKEPKNQIFVAGGIITISLGCSWAFRFNDEIKIKNKYMKVEGPRSLYMITTSKGKIYKFDKAQWKLHWSQAELWNSVEKGEKYRVKGFGIRLPFFGMYPNIHSVKHLV